MPRKPLGSILVATDLGEGSDEIVRSAAALAEAAGADLHALHVFELDSSPHGRDAEARGRSFPERIEAAERALAEQLHRTVPTGVHVRSRVVNYVAHRAINEQTEDVGANLIVLGPHRRRSGGAFVGTTADRVIRTAEVPCLILRGPLPLPIRRIGVPVDFSDTSRGALRVAVEWSSIAGATGAGEAAAPELRVMHVASALEAPDSDAPSIEALRRRLEREVEEALPPGEAAATLRTEVHREISPVGGILSLAREQDLDLLVMGTHGHGGLARLLIGSVASGVVREASCPVLLVPPALAARAARRQGRSEARLRKVLVAVDFREASVEGASWAVRHFSPDAEHLFAHVLHITEPPAFLGGPTAGMAEEIRDAEEAADSRLRGIAQGLGAEENVALRHGSPAEELSRLADEEGVDLVVVGPHARHGLAGWLGSTAESLLGSSPAPVLLARELPPGAPTRILAAVDASERARDILRWARALKEHFGADLEVVLAVDLLRYEPAFELAGHPPPTTAAFREAEESALGWIRERTREAGLADGEVRIHVDTDEPGGLILERAERGGAELIVMGSRGAGTAGRLLLGSMARTVLRRAPCPVLVVGDRSLALSHA